jgi:flagellar basal body rod protein FlgC
MLTPLEIQKIEFKKKMGKYIANDVDEATMVYWIITNAGGMDAKDVADFIRQLKHQHGASVDGDAGVNVTPHTTEAPYQARQAYLEQLKQDLYEDFQIVNVNQLSSGAKTATEIRAAYEPMNNKADQFEYCVLEFLHALFDIVGIEANPTFTRSMIVNELEETQMVLSAAQYLDDETVLKKLKWLTPEDVENILTRKAEESITRFEGGGE